MSKVVHGCRDCKYKKGDLFNFQNDLVARAMCIRRHSVVNVETMSKYCELYKFDPDYRDLDTAPDDSI